MARNRQQVEAAPGRAPRAPARSRRATAPRRRQAPELDDLRPTVDPSTGRIAGARRRRAAAGRGLLRAPSSTGRDALTRTSARGRAPHRDEEIEDWEVEAEDAIAAGGVGEAGYEVRGPARREAPRRTSKRPRVVQFLVAVWAELQRVQWPDRQALTTLTGVVLGFVLIMGGYLGLLDAIFSELIKRNPLKDA